MASPPVRVFRLGMSALGERRTATAARSRSCMSNLATAPYSHRTTSRCGSDRPMQVLAEGRQRQLLLRDPVVAVAPAAGLRSSWELPSLSWPGVLPVRSPRSFPASVAGMYASGRACWERSSSATRQQTRHWLPVLPKGFVKPVTASSGIRIGRTASPPERRGRRHCSASYAFATRWCFSIAARRRHRCGVTPSWW